MTIIKKPTSLLPSNRRTPKGFTRRNFLLKIGTGTTGVIACYFLGKSILEKPACSQGIDKERPKLKKGIEFINDDDRTVLRFVRKVNSSICAVNPTGLSIARRLDGKHTIPEIAKDIADKYKFQRDESFDAKIAYFVTQLGAFGFLENHFYVIIYEQA